MVAIEEMANRYQVRGRAPVVITVPADLITPVRAFCALTRPGDDAFLLESVVGGETQARYSFLGFEAREVFEAGRTAHIRRGSGVTALAGDPRAALARWVAGFTTPAEALPAPFLGGAVGSIDFSAFALTESVLEPAFPAARAARMTFGLFSTGLVLDHMRQEAMLYRVPDAGESDADARTRLAALAERLHGPVELPDDRTCFTLDERPNRARFAANLAAVQAAIAAGDAYQIVVSEPFAGTFTGDPFAVYRRLRRLNPSPYHFFISLGGRQLVGASPEMLVRVEGRRVSTVPIAGTRRRGATAAEDQALEQELRHDGKELAEHAMLVDLARNDLGRVCRPGTVTVPVRGVIERFSHVMHMTSEVEGELAPGRSALDAVWSTLPAGTVSGAPKIRAVEILSRLEGADRGVYGGAAGILAASGNVELCIAIRTLEFAAGRVRFGAGAGIVADSREPAEWQEIHAKAQALLLALGAAGERP